MCQHYKDLSDQELLDELRSASRRFKKMKREDDSNPRLMFGNDMGGDVPSLRGELKITLSSEIGDIERELKRRGTEIPAER